MDIGRDTVGQQINLTWEVQQLLGDYRGIENQLSIP